MKNYLSDRVQIVWFIPAVIVVAVIWSLVFMANLIFPESGNQYVTSASIMSVLVVVPSIIYLRLKYNNFYYEFGEDEIVIRQGIIGKRVDMVPYSKIQHLRTERTILEHLVGLVHIHIETAGSIYSENQPKIPGVPIDNHEKLIEFINVKAREKRGNNGGQTSISEEGVSLREVLYELKRINEKLEEPSEQRKKPIIKKDVPLFQKYDRFYHDV